MAPNIFLTSNFLDKVVNCSKDFERYSILDMSSNIESKRESLKRIVYLLLNSKIFYHGDLHILDSCLNDETKSIGFKELLLKEKIKGNSLISRKIDDLNSILSKEEMVNFCFFVDENQAYSERISDQIGRLVIGESILEKPFFLEQTFPSELTNSRIEQVERIKHPCSSLIILDSFIFEDDSRLDDKLPNIIHFIENMIHHELLRPFEVDIITNASKNLWRYEKKFNIIKNYFGEKVSLHVYASPGTKQEGDRFIITNYSVTVIPHPFDRKSTISNNFYPSQNDPKNILTSYALWEDKLRKAREIMNSTPEYCGTVKYSWKSDELIHQIFNYDKDL